jgi:hypothetical protein
VLNPFVFIPSMGGEISTQNQIKTRKWLVILEVFQSTNFSTFGFFQCIEG